MLRSGRMWMLLLGLCVVAGACVTTALNHAQKGKVSRGVIMTHAQHAERGVDCATCHTAENEDAPDFAIPTHEVCSTCHEIPAEYKEATDLTECARCHDRKGSDGKYQVTPRERILSKENSFSHAPHVKKEVACASCHENPDKAVLPAGDLMAFCVQCHAKIDSKHTDCAICHKIWRKNERPVFNSENTKKTFNLESLAKLDAPELTKPDRLDLSRLQRIAHDSPQIWQHVHGQESKADPHVCSSCHEKTGNTPPGSPESCEECHRKNPPASHTPAWRHKTHGMQAQWDRAKCSACHEEDSCLKCHKNTQPDSHRAGWDRPANLHCVSCHFPPEKTECTVCHERIEHRSAIPSPHDLGIYPVGKCGICHPGGLPNQAPHVMNSTVRCVVCHK